MKNFFYVCSILIINLNIAVSQTPSLTNDYITAGYVLTDLGSIPGLPTPYGGLTIKDGSPDTLYIGGSANTSSGKIYTVPLVRDPITGTITGFGSPSLYANAPYIDGGITFTPEGTLLFTQFPNHSMGQILPDNSYVSTSLNSAAPSASVGSLAFVPAGFPGAGGLIIAGYGNSNVYRVPFSVNLSGLYSFSPYTASSFIFGLANNPEGIAYVPIGSTGFPVPSMLISSFGLGKVVAFEVSPDGLPVASTAKDFVINLTGAEGAWIDQLTGDFLFSTFGASNRIIKVQGFVQPSAITTNVKNHSSILVFPNPANDSFTIQSTKGGVFELMDVTGKVINTYTLTKNQESIRENLPAGMYLVREKQSGATTKLTIY
jgi:hypothetical protein